MDSLLAPKDDMKATSKSLFSLHITNDFPKDIPLVSSPIAAPSPLTLKVEGDKAQQKSTSTSSLLSSPTNPLRWRRRSQTEIEVKTTLDATITDDDVQINK
jgi:hypothetical protein